MRTNYYISGRFLSRGVPFWVLPLVLFILLTGVLAWTLFTIQTTSSSRVFHDIENSVNGQSGSLKDRYTLALNHFKSRSYYSSAQQFKSLYYDPKMSEQIKQKSGLYYAYSLLLDGFKNSNERLIQDSNEVFSELLKTVPNNSPYYSRVLLGYAKSTRYLGLSYVVGIDAALRQLANMSLSESFKRQIYLELAYYYFTLNNYTESNNYFTRASLYIDSVNFYESLIMKEETAPFIMSLLKNNLIPQGILSTYGTQIKQKLLKSAMQFANTGNYISAKNILSIMINTFPLDSSSEDSYFLMGYIAQKEQNYKSAIHYYNLVISNGYLDKDPIALFQMALIYYRVGDVKTAAYYFNILTQKFPYSYYANEAQKWLEYFYPSTKKNMTMPTPPTISLDEKSPNYVFTQSADDQYTVAPSRKRPIIRREQTIILPPVVQQTAPTPPVNVNIDQSRSYVNNKQQDSNNNFTSLEKNDGSGNTSTVVQQKYPGTTTNNTTSGSNNIDSFSPRDDHNIAQSAQVRPKKGLEKTFEQEAQYNDEDTNDQTDSLKQDFEGQSQEGSSFNVSQNAQVNKNPKPQPETKIEEPPVVEEEKAPVIEPEPQITPQEVLPEEESLSQDFDNLDDSFVDRRPKFKPLF